jgi:hypothetical protein
MKNFDGHIECVNGVLIFSSSESNMYDILKDAVYSGGTGYKRNIFPPGAHFLFYMDLTF